MKEFLTIGYNFDETQKIIDSKNINLDYSNLKELPLNVENLKIQWMFNNELNLKELINLKELSFLNIQEQDISIELPKNLKNLKL